MTPLVALCRANTLTLLRDRTGLFWSFAVPVLIMLLFAAMYGRPQQFGISIIVSGARDPANAVVHAFPRIPGVSVTAGQDVTPQKALAREHADAVLAVPNDIADRLAARQPTDVILFYSRKPGTDRVVRGIVQGAMDAYERQIEGRPPSIRVREVPLGHGEFSYAQFLVPGIVAMGLMQTGVFGATYIVALRQSGGLRRLALTAMPPAPFFVAQVLTRLAHGITQLSFTAVVAFIVFRMPLSMGLFAAIPIVIVGVLAFAAMGMVIAGVVNSLEAARGLTQLLNLTMMFLGGVFYPVQNLPGATRAIGQVIPITYLADLLRATLGGVSPAFPVSISVSVLCAWLVGCSVLATRFFRWE